MGLSRQAYYQDQQRQSRRAHQAAQVVALVRECRLRQPHLPLKMQSPDAVHRASLAGLRRSVYPSQVAT